MQGPFKGYERGQRVQTTEELFSAGMNFTNAPLDETIVKELVNFDVKDNGQALVPRPGMRAYSVGVNSTDPTPFTENITISAGKFCVETDATQCSQLILGDVSNTLIPGTNLYQGKSTVMTVTEDVVGYLDGTITHYKAVSSGKGDTYEYSYNKPTKAEIHGIEVTETDNIASQVGTFAYTNGYYTYGNKSGKNYLMQTKYNSTAKKYEFNPLTPKELTPKEAVMWGYNMLADNPYYFKCTRAAGLINLTGLLPYDDKNNLVMTPQVNQTLNLKCFWAAPSRSFYIIWDYKEVGSSSWIHLKEAMFSTNALNPFTVQFSPPSATITIRIRVYEKAPEAPDPTKPETMVEPIPIQVLAVGFDFTKEDYGSTANVQPKKYNLNKSYGLSYWRNRLVAYGAPEDPTILFLSELNDPTYFPYPNNADTFDEPIIHAMAFLDNLLVFTTTQLYMLTLNEDGLSWTKKLIQSNLTINKWDLHLIRVVKNMVFFKSGNYYYMVVPKLNSMSGELVIAPISKSITSLLDNFKQNVENTVKMVYNYSDGLELIHYYNYLDFEDIHNVYVFKTKSGVYLNYVLLYNSISRYWRTYIFESAHIVKPFKQDATKKGILMSLFDYNGGAAVQFLQYTSDNINDMYVGNYNVTFKNYQMIDTGYRNHQADYKKRYRELQFKINNVSNQQLKFFTECTIDGALRKAYTKYNVTHHVDSSDPKYGQLTLERVFVDPSIVPSTTVLAEHNTDTDAWTLDSSTFPEAALWKVRIPISGKGYSPRLCLISLNSYPYELLNLAWVYRTLYSR